MKNTVLDEIDAEAVVEEIRLNFQTEKEPDVVIVVEGDDDEKALMKFFNLSIVGFHIANNCLLVAESMRIIKDDAQLKDHVIGIKDADFDYLKGIDYDDIPNLFLTDTHDMETMMLTDYVCRNICLEVLKKEYPSLLKETMEFLLPLSYLRYYNDKKVSEAGCHNIDGINFGGVDIGKVSPDCTPVSTASWIAHVKTLGNDGREIFPNEEQLTFFIADNRHDDKLHLLTNGHDLVLAIFYKLQTLNGKNLQYGKKDIPRLIRISFTFEEFTNTRLYENIVQWNSGRYELWAA